MGYKDCNCSNLSSAFIAYIIVHVLCEIVYDVLAILFRRKMIRSVSEG